MIFTANANATIETARHSVPLSAGSSTKARSTLLCPPKGIYARVTPPQHANDTDPGNESEKKATKDVPEVPPPSKFTWQYLNFDLSTTVANYAARLTAEVRNFRGWYTRLNDAAMADRVLEDLFNEVKELEVAYRARRANLVTNMDPYETASHEDEEGEDGAHSESSQDNRSDEDEDFLDALEWRDVEEAVELEAAPTMDDVTANIEAANRARSPVVANPSEEHDHCSDHEVSIEHEPVHVGWTTEDADAIKTEDTDTGAWLESLPHTVPAWIAEDDDDGYEASISSGLDMDRHFDAYSDTDTRSMHSYTPAPPTPTARPLPFPLPGDFADDLYVEAHEHSPVHAERPRTGITGLFRDLPTPFFAELNAVTEAQAILPPTTPPREVYHGVHRSEHSRHTRFDGPYRQHALRHMSASRDERIVSPARVRRNATAPELLRCRAV